MPGLFAHHGERIIVIADPLDFVTIGVVFGQEIANHGEIFLVVVNKQYFDRR